MTVVADPLEELLAGSPGDEDLSHWAFPPYTTALCGIEVEDRTPENEALAGTRDECPRCEEIAALWVNHRIWEGPGPRPAK
jgi:hypothetical protein